MSVKIECPSCSNISTYEDAYIADGDMYKCPKCQADITVTLDYEETETEEEAEEITQ